MNASKTRTLKRTQKDQQQQKIKQEPDQKDQFQDEEQDLEQEQEQAKSEIKRRKYHEREQQQEQREGPRPKTDPSQAAKKGKGQTIVEEVFSSESSSHYRKVSSQQGVTMEFTETAQRRAHARTTLTQPHTHFSNPAHQARPMGKQYRCQNCAASAGCRNDAPGIRHCCHRRTAHGKMLQMFPPELQPPRNRAMNPPIFSSFGLSAPVRNSMQQSPNVNFMQPSSQEADPAHQARPMGKQYRCQNCAASAGYRNDAPGIRHCCHRGTAHGKMLQMFPPELQPFRNRAMNPPIFPSFGLSAPVRNSMQQSPNVNFMQPSSQEAGIFMVHVQRPELTLGQIRDKIKEVCEQMIAESGNRPQQ